MFTWLTSILESNNSENIALRPRLSYNAVAIVTTKAWLVIWS